MHSFLMHVLVLLRRTAIWRRINEIIDYTIDSNDALRIWYSVWTWDAQMDFEVQQRNEWHSASSCTLGMSSSMLWQLAHSHVANWLNIWIDSFWKIMVKHLIIDIMLIHMYSFRSKENYWMSQWWDISICVVIIDILSECWYSLASDSHCRVI